MSLHSMKATRTFSLVLASACTLLAQAQIEHRVNLLDGSVIAHPLNTMDSITFNTDGVSTMMMHLAAAPAVPVELAQVDTVAFGTLSTWTFTDPRDDNEYAVVMIGNQCWMAENLRYLPSVVGPASGSPTVPLYYVHGYNGTNVLAAKATANYQTYGVLYNWRAAMQGAASSTSNPSGVQGACPPGWHLPSDEEVKQLEMFLGLTQNQANGNGIYRGTNQGSRLAGSANLWVEGDLKNHPVAVPVFGNTGFNARPGSVRALGAFGNTLGQQFTLWTATQQGSPSYAWYRGLYYTQTGIYRANIESDHGMSVRCVCDQ
jgi:uncharacterized protein (TIGR02145 family)